MDKERLWELVNEATYQKGNFTLRSGEHTDHYYDKYKFESDPQLLKEIAKQMAPLIPRGTEIIAGPVLGGAILATSLSLETGIKTAFIRQEAKAYGGSKIIEGENVTGKKVCISEDIITTGGQAIEAARKIRAEGGIVDTVICVINRGQNSVANLEKENLKLIPLFPL